LLFGIWKSFLVGFRHKALLLLVHSGRLAHYLWRLLSLRVKIGSHGQLGIMQTALPWALSTSSPWGLYSSELLDIMFDLNTTVI